MGDPVGQGTDGVLIARQSCQGVTQAYDWIESVLSDGELGEFCLRLQIYGGHPMSNALKRKIVAILAL